MALLPGGEIGETSYEGNDFLITCNPFSWEINGRLTLGYRCQFQTAAYQDCLFDRFAITFPSQLERAVSKRRSEYLAGRLCARYLLERLGTSPGQSDVLMGTNREPIWPAGIVASISHSADLAVCVATDRQDVFGLGVDIEIEIPANIADEIRNLIVDRDEETVFRNHFSSYRQGLTAVFSAKESIYKAASRFSGRVFGFSAMRLVRMTPDQMVFAVAEALSERLHLGIEISVNYRITETEILAATCLLRQ